MSYLFTIEEGNLIALTAEKGRTSIIRKLNDMSDNIINDTEMFELIASLTNKLINMTNEEFEKSRIIMSE